MCREGQNGILLHFDGAEDGFYRKKKDCEGAAKPEELIAFDGGEEICESGFEIGEEKYISEADDKKEMYYPAKAQVLGSDIFICNPSVNEPVCARYGNDNYFRPIFLDKEGRPIVPFWI